jgi:hypothetical protein
MAAERVGLLGERQAAAGERAFGKFDGWHLGK